MGKIILVAGGTGFLGRKVVGLIQKKGHTVIVQNRENRSIPTYADVIVNCVGIIREDEQTFKDAHVETTRSLLKLGKKLGIKQFVQVSALGVDREQEQKTRQTEYQRTKLQADRMVEQSGLPYVILRPSMIFGKDDKSTNRIRAVCRTGFFPLFANGKVQPVSADTVAEVIVAAVELRMRNRIVEIGGPEVFTYKELARRLHPGVRAFRSPWILTRLITSLGIIMKSLPTKEQVIMMEQDNVTSQNALERLGIQNPRLK